MINYRNRYTDFEKNLEYATFEDEKSNKMT